MDVNTLHSEQDTVHAALPCAHCGLPVGPHPSGNGPFFCCTGCELVHEALTEAGYSHTFYQLSNLSSTDKARQPAASRQHDIHLLELDTQTFLETHTHPAGGTSRRVTLFLDGVHCAACVWLVERLPAEVEGINSARLDLSRGHLTLQFEPDTIRLSNVARWLAQFGYQAYPVHQRQRNDKTRAERRLLIKTGVAWALAGNVMLFAFAMYAGLDLSASGDASNVALATGARWASMALALVSVVYGGSEFFKNAWSSLRIAFRHRNVRGLHMDTPISLGILVGFGYGAWATVSGQGEVWFDSITTLIAALLTARWLQLRSYRLAGDATDRLLNFIPTMARLVQSQSTGRSSAEQLVKVDALQAGDLILVPAGEVIPVDGEVTAGKSIVDKSVLTGESRPEELAVGVWAEAGTTNLQSPVEVRVAATGDTTRVGRLLSWVGEHAAKRAPVVMLADRLSGYFVAVLLCLAIGTSIAWYLIEPEQVAARVVALLVISCPCALGMATPLAMAIAAGRAARQGIFIKSSEAVQVIETVDAVILDKTGTLTEGRMTVVETAGDPAAIQLAGQLEQHSNHPIAQAILRETTTLGDCPTDPTITSIQVIQGSGVTGHIAGKAVFVGQPAWVLQHTGTNPVLEAELRNFAQSGHTPVAIGVDRQLAAVLAIGDKMRTNAPSLVQHLGKHGKQAYLLSGDAPAVVHQLARALGIPEDRAQGGVSPEEKKAFIASLQAKGHIVGMVGDGVNDAAALQAADVGIAVEGGTTPSQVAADVFLTREGLQPVVDTFEGAGKVMGVVRKNLGFSLVYNILGATAAIAGFVTPFVAALAMPASSLIVVLGSVLQRSFRTATKP